MNGAISNIDALERFFRGVNAPFFTLSYYSTQSPTGQGNVILRNIRETNIDSAWALLRRFVEDQTGYGRAQMHLIVYESEKTANTPSGRTNIDIYGAAGSNNAGLAAIGNLPSGLVDEAKVQALIREREELWQLQRENDDLRAQIESPGDFWDKAMAFVDKIGNTPIGMALASKILGQPIPTLNNHGLPGVHTADNADAPDSDDVDSELDELEGLATANGMTLKQFLAKTAHLARQQPGIVAMLSQQ